MIEISRVQKILQSCISENLIIAFHSNGALNITMWQIVYLSIAKIYISYLRIKEEESTNYQVMCQERRRLTAILNPHFKIWSYLSV